MTMHTVPAGGGCEGPAKGADGASRPAVARWLVAGLLALAVTGAAAWGLQRYRAVVLRAEVQALRQEAAELRRLQAALAGKDERIPERGKRIPEKR